MKLRWAPALILCIGLVLVASAGRQRSVPLARPLGDVVPLSILEYDGADLFVSPAEAEVAGFSNYLQRVYEPPIPDSSPQ